MIEIRNLKAQNDEKTILDIEYFVFDENEVYLIAGMNGSGKSSFIKVLANDIDESKYQHLKLTGRIYADGEDILTNVSAREKFNKYLCYVSQDDEFLTNSIENELRIYYGIANGISISKKELISILQELNVETLLLKTFNKKELTEVFKLKLNSLSGGQKKIIHIVRELVKNDKIKYVLLDEPLNNLDIKNITTISNLINGIKADKTLIIVSHCKIFPFITKEIKLSKGKFSECNYDCASCFGRANDAGFYE